MTRKSCAVLAAALALAAPSPALAAYDGSYKGETNEDFNAFATVKKGKVSFSMALNTRCRNFNGTYTFRTDYVEFKKAKLKGSRFKHSEKGDETDGKATYVAKGKLSGSKMKVTVAEFFRGGCTQFDIVATLKRK